MSLSQIKQKIFSVLTIGVASWMIALEGLKLINKYVPENNLVLKSIIIVGLLWIGFSFNG